MASKDRALIVAKRNGGSRFYLQLQAEFGAAHRRGFVGGPPALNIQGDGPGKAGPLDDAEACGKSRSVVPDLSRIIRRGGRVRLSEDSAYSRYNEQKNCPRDACGNMARIPHER